MFWYFCWDQNTKTTVNHIQKAFLVLFWTLTAAVAPLVPHLPLDIVREVFSSLCPERYYWLKHFWISRASYLQNTSLYLVLWRLVIQTLFGILILMGWLISLTINFISFKYLNIYIHISKYYFGFSLSFSLTWHILYTVNMLLNFISCR